MQWMRRLRARGRLDLRSEQAYWLLHNGLGEAHRALDKSVECDVVVIGAGITGMLVTHALARAGFHVIVIDRRDLALGSTSASTALLQYEIDEHLIDLQKRLGTERAALAYHAGVTAIEQAARLPAVHDAGVGFERCDSLYLASTEPELPEIAAELEARQAIGIEARWLDRADLLSRYGCDRPGAILSTCAARLDPFRLARLLFREACARGAQLYARTSVEAIEPDGVRMRAVTATGWSITADFAVVCAGYESLAFLPAPVASLHGTFAWASRPVDELAPGFAKTVVWESARPYLYARATQDARYIVGGEDVPFRNAKARDALLARKTRVIARRFGELFPHIDAKPEYAWAGTFGETVDGLPYIGPHPMLPRNLIFALCFGGNGITYSIRAAEMLLDRIQGRSHELDAVFGFDRTVPGAQSKD